MLPRDDSFDDTPRDDVPPVGDDGVGDDGVGDDGLGDEGVAEDSGPRHSDAEPVQPVLRAFRISRPKHLREEAPVPPPPPPVDPRKAAARENSTVPMPVVEADPESRRRPGRRTWIAAASAIMVVAAGTFVLSTQRSDAGGTPTLDARVAEPSAPEVLLTESWSATPTPPPSATATPTRTPRPSRSATHTPSSAAALAPPADAPPTAARTTTPPPAATTPPGPTPLPIVPHTGALRIATSGKCLDDWTSSTADGNPIQVYSCNGTGAQTFTFGADGTLRVLGKCIKPASSSSGALVQLRNCDGGSAQSWYFRSDKVIVNKSSGRCLTNTGALTNNLPQSTMATCAGNATQQWTFT